MESNSHTFSTDTFKNIVALLENSLIPEMFASKNIYIVGAIAVLLIICTAIHQAIAFPTEDEAFARNLRASKKLPFAFGDVVATNKFPIVRSFNGKWISGACTLSR